MTKNQAKKIMEEEAYKKVIFQIMDMLNGESLSEALQLLAATEFFIKENCFVDAEIAKSLLENWAQNEEE